MTVQFDYSNFFLVMSTHLGKFKAVCVEEEEASITFYKVDFKNILADQGVQQVIREDFNSFSIKLLEDVQAELEESADKVAIFAKNNFKSNENFKSLAIFYQNFCRNPSIANSEVTDRLLSCGTGMEIIYEANPKFWFEASK